MKELRERMKKRGLEKEMMLGMSTDNMPTEPVIALFKAIAPGIEWVSHGHVMPDSLHGVPVGYLSGVWRGGIFAQDPSLGHSYGWKRPDLKVHHPRSMFDSWPACTFRLLGELNITGQQRGFARLGADFWPVLKGKRAWGVQSIAARFPKTSWRNLDIHMTLLAPGPEGAVSTARFEMIREGLQECEARIFIEDALTDDKLRAKLGDDLAARAQKLLDDRVRAMRRGVSTLRANIDLWTTFAYIDNTWWQAPGIVGSQWFVESDWQGRTEGLYSIAAEVAAKVGK
jgi:hypothetical protein